MVGDVGLCEKGGAGGAGYNLVKHIEAGVPGYRRARVGLEEGEHSCTFNTEEGRNTREGKVGYYNSSSVSVASGGKFWYLCSSVRETV